MAKNKTVSSTTPTANQSWIYNSKLIAICLFAFSFLIYANTLQHDYTQDDAIVITDNMFTKQGFAGIPGLLQHDTFYGFFKKENKDKLVAGGRYRPLTPIMFAIEQQFFGNSPFVGHLFNAIYYGLLVVLIYWLMLLLFQKRPAAEAAFIAIATALLYASHPLHTEAVANIKGRDEIMAMIFSISALYLSIKGWENKKILWSILAALSLFLGLLSKENAIMFLFIVPLSYYIFTAAKVKEIVQQTAPLILAAIVFLLIRGSILGWDMGDPSREIMNNPYLKLVDGQYIDYTFGEKLATIMYTLGKYIQLFIVPHPLTHDYYPFHIDLMSWSDWSVLLSLALYIGLGLYGVRAIIQKQAIGFAILFFLITLSIVSISNIVLPIGTHMSERFMFMPSLGLALMVALLLQKFMRNSTSIRWIIIGGICLLFTGKTITRNAVWKDNYTLFTTDIKTSTNSAKLLNAAAGALSTKASTDKNQTRKAKDLRLAITYANRAIEKHPNYKNAWLILGNCHNWLQEYESALNAYNNALSIDPNYTEAHTNIAITYRQAGQYYGEQKGDLNKAITYLSKAYELNPNEYETVRLLGVAYGISQNHSKAIEFFTKGTELAPNNASAWYDLGTAYMFINQQEQASIFIAKAQEIDPEIGTKRGRNNN